MDKIFQKHLKQINLIEIDLKDEELKKKKTEISLECNKKWDSELYSSLSLK